MGPKTIGVVIADDEALARNRLRVLLEGEPDMEVLGEAETGLEALALIARLRPELAFLDVQMPDLDGIGVVAALPEDETPEVVFVTAYHEYMERAFELHAVDFLRKPYTNQRFGSALEFARRRVRARRLERQVESSAEEPPPSRYSPILAAIRDRRATERMAVRDPGTGNWDILDPERVERIQANRGEGVLLFAGGKSFSWKKSMGEVETLLDPETFLRVHRSHIVNVRRVVQVKPLFKGEYAFVLESGAVIDSGRSYQQAVERFIDGPRPR